MSKVTWLYETAPHGCLVLMSVDGEDFNSVMYVGSAVQETPIDLGIIFCLLFHPSVHIQATAVEVTGPLPRRRMVSLRIVSLMESQLQGRMPQKDDIVSNDSGALATKIDTVGSDVKEKT